jgi:hypothetical protein
VGKMKIAAKNAKDHEEKERRKITNYNKQITNKSQIQNYKLQKVLPGALV